jgi:hypothetical protein
MASAAENVCLPRLLFFFSYELCGGNSGASTRAPPVEVASVLRRRAMPGQSFRIAEVDVAAGIGDLPGKALETRRNAAHHGVLIMAVRGTFWGRNAVHAPLAAQSSFDQMFTLTLTWGVICVQLAARLRRF